MPKNQDKHNREECDRAALLARWMPIFNLYVIDGESLRI